jgi:hypothetical protein
MVLATVLLRLRPRDVGGSRPRPYRPRLELLEDRNLLSTFTVDHLTDDLVGAGLNGSLRYVLTNAVNGDTVTFATDHPDGGLPGDYAFTAADAGTHTFAGGVILYADGSTITVTDTTLTTLTGCLVVPLT